MNLPFFLARRFVAADSLKGTLPVAAALHQDGLFTTLDLLGEYISEKHLAEEARDSYLKLVAALGAQDEIDRNISIKLSMLGQKIDEGYCLDNLHRLLTAARDTDTFVRLDMEGSDVTESTVGILEKVHPEYPQNVGIVLQAYLKRTGADVERMCELGARVRLCKGAYREPASIAWQDMTQIREHYLSYMEMLVQRGNYPAIATHDDILINATKAYVADQAVSTDSFEFQMLFGIRAETQRSIAAEGFNMRVYVPYGRKWYPYFSRRLRERKENVWFVLKHLFVK